MVIQQRNIYLLFSFAVILITIGIINSNVFATSTCTTDETTGRLVCTDNASVSASVNVASACSFTRTSGSGEYTGILANGATVTVPGSTFKTTCNDVNGYAIYAIGFSNNEFGNTDLIAQNIGSEHNIKTDGENSNWKMQISAVSGTFTPTILNNFDSPHNIPNEYTKIASYSTSTITPADSTSGSSITTSYQATASSTQPADEYIGQVKYTLVHPSTIDSIPGLYNDCPAHYICYQRNDYGDAEGVMGNQMAPSLYPIALWASNYSRKNYGFAGWNTMPDGSGTSYGPNETIDTPADIDQHGLTLYAMWVESTGNLQNWTGCPDLDINEVTALTDTRDGDTYAVAKLADGNCWMIENLRLDDSADINASNTNNPAPGFKLPPSSQGCAEPIEECLNLPTLNTDNTVLRSERDNHVYSYGDRYSWNAATAGTGVNIRMGDDASGSICPIGWELPTSITSSNKSYFNLNEAIKNEIINPEDGSELSNKWRAYPNNFIAISNGYFSDVHYSRTSYSSNIYARFIRVEFSGVFGVTDGGYMTNSQIPIRCINS